MYFIAPQLDCMTAQFLWELRKRKTIFFINQVPPFLSSCWQISSAGWCLLTHPFFLDSNHKSSVSRLSSRLLVRWCFSWSKVCTLVFAFLSIKKRQNRAEEERQTQSLKPKTTNQARNLGVVMDPGLNFNNHIKSIMKSAYYHLKNIWKITGLMQCRKAGPSILQ